MTLSLTRFGTNSLLARSAPLSVLLLALLSAPVSAPVSAQTVDQTDPAAQPQEATPPQETPLPQETMAAKHRAVLQGLDKITARVSEFEAPVGEAVRFGTFEITVRACRKTPPEEPPESTAYLEIVDVRPDGPARLVFEGWMFASSPALSAVEHPVYDVWVTSCRAPEPAQAAEAAPENGSGTEGSDTAAQ